MGRCAHRPSKPRREVGITPRDHPLLSMLTPYSRRLCALAAGLSLFVGSASGQSPAPTRTLPSPTPQDYAWFGGELVPAGDVNADGVPDLIVGAHAFDTDDVPNAGRAFVVSGSNGAHVLTLDSPNPEENGRFGRRAAAAGDVDGDGHADILVAADGEGGDWFNGRVYLFSGDGGALLRTYASPSGLPVTWFGYSVANVGDVNGDGVPEHLIGARFDGDDTTQPGRAYLFSGATGALLRTHAGADPNQLADYGSVVAALGDVNGDAFPDYAVSAVSEPGAAGLRVGRVYVYSGWQGHLLYTIAPPAPRENGSFGGAVAALGDVTGDGRAEFAIAGTIDPVNGRTNAGTVYVFSGATGALVRTVLPPTPTEDGLFGQPLLPAGDVDRDGRADLYAAALVGTPGASARQGYFISGATGAIIAPVLTPYGSAGFGTAFALIGDLNNDGQLEFTVGSPGEDWESGVRRGVVHYYRTGPFAPVTVAGPQGWRLLAASGPLQSFDRLVGGLWTQGVPGADVSTGDPSLFQYNEPTPGGRDGGFAPIAGQARPMEVGRGYAVYVFEDDDLLTPGVQGGFPKTLAPRGYESGGRVTFPVTFTPSAGGLAEDGWNLVGNPFDAFLDWDDPQFEKVGLDNVIYVWDPQSGQYETWNGTTGSYGSGLINRYTGFWVKASAAPSLVSSYFSRVEAPVFHDPPADPPAVVAFRAEARLGGRDVAGEAFVTLGGAGRDGQDALDAYELVPLAPTYLALFSRGADTPGLDINALPAPSGAVEIPLDVQAVADRVPVGAEVTLSWPELRDIPAAWRLTLVDLQTGATTDLRTQSDYTLTIGAQGRLAPAGRVLADGPPVPTVLDAGADGRSAGRLVLRVEAAVVAADDDEAADEASLSVPSPNPTRTGARLAFTLAHAGHARLAVYDVLGREVAVVADGAHPAGAHEADFRAAGLAPGLYVVRLEAAGRSLTRSLTLVR